MKRQIKSSIKAHFIRRAALSLLLVAICIIPFARGQRNAGEKVRAHINRSVVARAPQISNAYGRAPVVLKRSPIAPFLLNGPLGATCPSTITQSTSQAIVDGNSVACNNGVGITENHYWRAFDMNTFTGGQEYDVTSVSFGIELAQIWKRHGPAVDSQSLCKQWFTVPRRRLAVESDRHIGRTQHSRSSGHHI